MLGVYSFTWLYALSEYIENNWRGIDCVWWLIVPTSGNGYVCLLSQNSIPNHLLLSPNVVVPQQQGKTQFRIKFCNISLSVEFLEFLELL